MYNRVILIFISPNKYLFFYKNIMAKKSGRKSKFEVKFDPGKRKEFLTGFRKRKDERRKKAKEI